jgi:hypothetical protein
MEIASARCEIAIANMEIASARCEMTLAGMEIASAKWEMTHAGTEIPSAKLEKSVQRWGKLLQKWENRTRITQIRLICADFFDQY